MKEKKCDEMKKLTEAVEPELGTEFCIWKNDSRSSLI